jgi:hypothetical protein
LGNIGFDNVIMTSSLFSLSERPSEAKKSGRWCRITSAVVSATLVAFWHQIPAHATCSVEPEGEQAAGHNTVWRIENDVVVLRIRPDLGGSIDDFRLKSSGQQTLMPFRESRVETVPGTGVFSAVRPPASGARDAIWPGGIDEFHGPYEFEIAERSAQRVRIVMTTETPRWHAERELLLNDGESSLHCSVRFTWKGQETKVWSYWNQNILRLADTLFGTPGDDSELVLMPGRVTDKPVQDITRPLKATQIVQRNPEDRASYFIAPAQPWQAALDRTYKLIFGVTYETSDFPQDMVYLSWPGSTLYSMEAIYPRLKFEPGQTRTYEFEMMVLTGLDTIHLLRPNYALELRNMPIAPVHRGEPLQLRLSAVATGTRQSLDLRLLLRKAQPSVKQAVATRPSTVPWSSVGLNAHVAVGDEMTRPDETTRINAFTQPSRLFNTSAVNTSALVPTSAMVTTSALVNASALKTPVFKTLALDTTSNTSPTTSLSKFRDSAFGTKLRNVSDRDESGNGSLPIATYPLHFEKLSPSVASSVDCTVETTDLHAGQYDFYIKEPDGREYALLGQTVTIAD